MSISGLTVFFLETSFLEPSLKFRIFSTDNDEYGIVTFRVMKELALDRVEWRRVVVSNQQSMIMIEISGPQVYQYSIICHLNISFRFLGFVDFENLRI